MVLTYFLASLFGFVFWTVAARFFSVDDIGLGTAAISACGLLVTLSGLGLGYGIIRFLPEESDKGKLINSSISIIAVISAILALVFLVGVKIWSPALSPLQQSVPALAFVLITVFEGLYALLMSTFIALRVSQFALIQVLLNCIRIPLVVILFVNGLTGILLSFSLAFIISDAVSVFLLKIPLLGYSPVPSIKLASIKKIIRFSIGNYVADGLRVVPNYTLPVIVVNVLSPEMGAYFFASWMIANLLLLVSYATSLTFVAEGVTDGYQTVHVEKALKFIAAVLLPGVLILVFFGNNVLSLFGDKYSSEGLVLLQILAVASIPAGPNEVFVGIRRIERRTGQIIALYGIIAVVTAIGGFLLAGAFGLVGFGLAFLGSHCLALSFTIPVVVGRLRHKKRSIYDRGQKTN